jgi:SAM-dependent methyltransferase
VPPTHSRRAVAIVTGGASQAARDVARGLASSAWAIVVVYLEHQSRAEATVAEIIAAGGTTVAVRADLADDLDVQRVFTESIAAFGGVDVVVHTTTDSAAFLFRHAARFVRPGGAIISTSAAERIPPGVARQLRERGITVGRALPEAVLAFLEDRRRRTISCEPSRRVI